MTPPGGRSFRSEGLRLYRVRLRRGHGVRLDRHTGVLIAQMALPVAVTSYLLAAKYGAEAQPVAGLAVVSTLMAVVALPLILAVFV